MSNIMNIIGISALVSIIITFIFDMIKHQMNIRFENLFSEKAERYRNILIFMSVVVDVENFEHIQTNYKPLPDSTKDEIINYYKKELMLHKDFCILFADEIVIASLSEFIEEPTHERFDKTAKAMRYDLWHSKYKKGNLKNLK